MTTRRTVLGETAGGKRVYLDLEHLVGSRMLLQANSGGGKSWALRRLLERTHGQIQQLVIDPEGEFYTLRERYDYVLAGRGGDCPAEPRSAHLLARRLLELGTSAVIDIYELKAHQRVVFVRRFLEALVDAPRKLWHPALVVVDEAHVFAPQKGNAESAAAVIDLMSRGRKRGFCGILATQRISKLHKDAAAEANNYLIGRAALDVDMKRAADELGFSGRDEQHRLRRLRPGEFFAFGPALADEVTQIKIGGVATSHPKAGAQAAPPAPPRAKVKAVLSQLADLPAEVEKQARTMETLQHDLREARTEIRRLKSQSGAPSPEDLERARQEGFVEGQRQVAKVARQHQDCTEAAVGALDRALVDVEKARDAITQPLDINVAELPPPAARQLQRPPPAPTARPASQPSPKCELIEGVSRPRQRILDALAWLEAAGIKNPLRAVVAFLADQSPRSSGYANNLGALRAQGLLDYPAGGRLAITDDGHAIAQAPAHAPTAEDLQANVLSHLSAPQQRILRALIDAYPESLTRDELAGRAEQSPTSSGYANNLGSLRNSWELVDYSPPGCVVARPVLFLGEES